MHVGLPGRRAETWNRVSNSRTLQLALAQNCDIMWTYRSFAVAETDVVSDWLATYAGDSYSRLRAKLDVRMTYLRDQPIWKDPFYHPLTGQKGIGAVRFEYLNVQYRPLGFFGPGAKTFTFVYFATEKGNKYLPKNCLQEAINRMKAVNAEPAKALQITRWDNAR